MATEVCPPAGTAICGRPLQPYDDWIILTTTCCQCSGYKVFKFERGGLSRRGEEIRNLPPFIHSFVTKHMEQVMCNCLHVVEPTGYPSLTHLECLECSSVGVVWNTGWICSVCRRYHAFVNVRDNVESCPYCTKVYGEADMVARMGTATRPTDALAPHLSQLLQWDLGSCIYMDADDNWIVYDGWTWTRIYIPKSTDLDSGEDE